MKLYNFARLINKYSVTFELLRIQGGYVAGKWVEDAGSTTQMRGAIVPIQERKLYQSGGTFGDKDQELYLLQPLEGDLSDFRVAYKGNTYCVEKGRNFEDYADVAIYTLKWVEVSQ